VALKGEQICLRAHLAIKSQPSSSNLAKRLTCSLERSWICTKSTLV